jgi:hypothetical protein
MPCLVLEIALAKGRRATLAWGRQAGLMVR